MTRTMMVPMETEDSLYARLPKTLAGRTLGRRSVQTARALRHLIFLVCEDKSRQTAFLHMLRASDVDLEWVRDVARLAAVIGGGWVDQDQRSELDRLVEEADQAATLLSDEEVASAEVRERGRAAQAAESSGFWENEALKVLEQRIRSLYKRRLPDVYSVEDLQKIAGALGDILTDTDDGMPSRQALMAVADRFMQGEMGLRYLPAEGRDIAALDLVARAWTEAYMRKQTDYLPVRQLEWLKLLLHPRDIEEREQGQSEADSKKEEAEPDHQEQITLQTSPEQIREYAARLFARKGQGAERLGSAISRSVMGGSSMGRSSMGRSSMGGSSINRSGAISGNADGGSVRKVGDGVSTSGPSVRANRHRIR